MFGLRSSSAIPSTTGCTRPTEAAAMAPTITDELHAMLVKRAYDLEG